MIRAAGGVLWRRDGHDVEIALVHRPRYDDWSLPKGKLEPDEHPLLAAVREVREETGLTVRAGRWLTSTSYAVAGEPKEVDYWATEATGGQFSRGDEVDDLRWLPPVQAEALLSNPVDCSVINAFLGGPHDTTPVLVVRHGSAGDADSWHGDDALRPLDDIGRDQAHTLAKLLPVYGPTRVIAADRVRCRDTVRPLAERLGLGLEIDPDFGEDSHARHPGHMADRIRSLGARGNPVVICSQGGVIPDSVALLARHDDLPLPAKGARKGSVWALHFTGGGNLVAADYFPRPMDPARPAAAGART